VGEVLAGSIVPDMLTGYVWCDWRTQTWANLTHHTTQKKHLHTRADATANETWNRMTSFTNDKNPEFAPDGKVGVSEALGEGTEGLPSPGSWRTTSGRGNHASFPQQQQQQQQSPLPSPSQQQQQHKQQSTQPSSSRQQFTPSGLVITSRLSQGSQPHSQPREDIAPAGDEGGPFHDGVPS